MISEGTEIRVNHRTFRVESFQKIDDVLWVELEEDGYSWPRTKAMVTFEELVRNGQIKNRYEDNTPIQPTPQLVVLLTVTDFAAEVEAKIKEAMSS